MKNENKSQLSDKSLESVNGGNAERSYCIPGLYGMPILCKTKKEALDFCNEMKKYNEEKYEDLSKKIMEDNFKHNIIQ